MNNDNETQIIMAPQYNTIDMILLQALGDSLDASVLASESGFNAVDMIIKAGEKLSQRLYGKAV